MSLKVQSPPRHTSPTIRVEREKSKKRETAKVPMNEIWVRLNSLNHAPSPDRNLTSKKKLSEPPHYNMFGYGSVLR